MNSAAQPTNRDLVVLVHGLASSRLLLVPLARRLRKRGFETRLWGYFSYVGSNRNFGRSLARKVHQLAEDGTWPRIHLVVHSMGSIIARCALEDGLPDRLGRIVMIGPPNGGSHMATRLRYIHPWCNPMLELMDRPDSFVNQLPPPPAEAEIGVIAAGKDNVIDLPRTHLPGERDHRVVDSWHTGVLWAQETAELTTSFLRHGSFSGGDRVVRAKPEAAGLVAAP